MRHIKSLSKSMPLTAAPGDKVEGPLKSLKALNQELVDAGYPSIWDLVKTPPYIPYT